ncbi:MAG: hypothetical protein KJS92_01200 [Bacteroidetes bacterium]|nr:hypothetical protein [Bacteroidota bacterium]
MHQTITQEDIIRYTYGETAEEETVLIEQALASNEQLQDFYILMKQVADDLNNMKMTPHPTTVRIILEESQDSSLEISS